MAMGWVVSLQGLEIGGPWTTPEQCQHINYLPLLQVFYPEFPAKAKQSPLLTLGVYKRY